MNVSSHSLYASSQGWGSSDFVATTSADGSHSSQLYARAKKVAFDVNMESILPSSRIYTFQCFDFVESG